MNTEHQLENFKWSSGKKIAFRFFFIYFLLFILLNNNGAYPFYQIIQSLFNKMLYQFVPWVGKTILGITYEIATGPNGSGDTTYDYVLIFTIFSVAILSTSVWSILDKNRKNYKKLYYWLTLAIRLYVGLMLINYGLVKIIKLQFSSPTMMRLTQAYGESSPMGLAWTFLGFSDGYNLFMGIAEVAAVLLLFRRTLTFGAIITLMTSANVMAVNYFFDVPVKILSTHLVLMTGFLLAYNFKQLWDFFFNRLAVTLTTIYKPNFKKRFTRFSTVMKVVLITYVLGFGLYQTIQRKEMYAGDSSKSFLQGFYEVKDFTINDSIADNKIKKWKYLMIESKEYASVKYDDDTREWYEINVDSTANRLSLKSYRDTLKIFNLNYIKLSDTLLHVKGNVKHDNLEIQFKRTIDYEKSFLLTNRGFHWINEYPFNR